MAIKIYKSTGKRTWQVNKIINQIQPIIDDLASQDPNFSKNFIPATNFQELEILRNKYLASDVEFEETKTTDNTVENFKKDNMSETIDVEFEEEKNKPEKNETNALKFDDDDSSFFDPLNREEPIVRDYVLDKDLHSSKTHFEEPSSFSEAFDFPDENVVQEDNSNKNKKEKNTTKQSYSEDNEEQEDSLNPDFNSMDKAKQIKQTKKFAKYIIEAGCMLLEKGFVWYANKDINANKLAEYELNGEMDLTLFVTLSNGQEVTIKKFFEIQCENAETLSKFTEEEKKDLADDLAAILLEKGFAPTSNQQMLLTGLTIVAGKVIQLVQIKSETNNVLNQLKLIKQENGSGYSNNNQYSHSEPQQEYKEPYHEVEKQKQEIANSVGVPDEKIEEKISTTNEGDFDTFIIDNPIETKE